MDSREIRSINIKINSLKEEHIKELNTINHYYWPIIAKLVKSKKYSRWLLVISICLFFSVSLFLLLKNIVNEYWIGASLGLSLIFLIINFIWFYKSYSKYYKINKIWNQALKKTEAIKIEKEKLCVEAVEAMLQTINVPHLKDEIGDSYDEVLEYYNSWVEK